MDEYIALNCLSEGRNRQEFLKDIALVVNFRPDFTKAIDDQGRTPLHVVAEHGWLAACRVLLDGGAGVNVKTKEGLTPLHIAAKNGGTEVCQLLIERGAAILAVNATASTALHIAAAHDRAERN